MFHGHPSLFEEKNCRQRGELLFCFQTAKGLFRRICAEAEGEVKDMILTRKIEIACRKKEDYAALQTWLKQCRLMANKVMTHYYTAYQEMLDKKPAGMKESTYFQNKFGCSFRNSGYRYLRERFREQELPSYFSRDIGTKVFQDFQADKKNGLLKGERSLRTYRNGFLPLHNQDIHLYQESDTFVLRWIRNMEFLLRFGKDRSGNRTIVERILEGTYKAAGSQIIKDWRKKKWFLLLCVDIPAPSNELDENAVVGVDLGIAVPAVCALNNGLARAFIGSSNLLKRFAMQKKQRSRQREFIPSNNKHGRQKVDKAIFKMQDKERRFVHSFNHKISKKIIQFAKKHKAAVIRMEDLSGYDRSQTLLRNWSYHELQQMIEYKAQREGIRVEKLSARYTSQACSQCGHIDPENRKSQSDFVCKQCGYKVHADYNAALNIARGGVKIPQEKAREGLNESDE
jgi:IS605 OrfB family transposase